MNFGRFRTDTGTCRLQNNSELPWIQRWVNYKSKAVDMLGNDRNVWTCTHNAINLTGGGTSFDACWSWFGLGTTQSVAQCIPLLDTWWSIEVAALFKSSWSDVFMLEIRTQKCRYQFWVKTLNLCFCISQLSLDWSPLRSDREMGLCGDFMTSPKSCISWVFGRGVDDKSLRPYPAGCS